MDPEGASTCPNPQAVDIGPPSTYCSSLAPHAYYAQKLGRGHCAPKMPL